MTNCNDNKIISNCQLNHYNWPLLVHWWLVGSLLLPESSNVLILPGPDFDFHCFQQCNVWVQWFNVHLPVRCCSGSGFFFFVFFTCLIHLLVFCILFCSIVVFFSHLCQTKLFLIGRRVLDGKNSKCFNKKITIKTKKNSVLA